MIFYKIVIEMSKRHLQFAVMKTAARPVTCGNQELVRSYKFASGTSPTSISRKELILHGHFCDVIVNLNLQNIVSLYYGNKRLLHLNTYRGF